MNDEKSNPCLSCGLCCIYYPTLAKKYHPQEWAGIENDEVKNVPRTLYRITRKTPIIDFHREEGTDKFIKDKPDTTWRGFRRCVALEGVQTVEVKCNVYENRPKVCSEFKPGSERCNNIREWGGLEKI